MKRVELLPMPKISPTEENFCEADIDNERITVRQIIKQELRQKYCFELDHIAPIEITFRNVTIWVENRESCFPFKKKRNCKLILNSASGQFKSGTSTAIIGSSGSGKTSLLNFL